MAQNPQNQANPGQPALIGDQEKQPSQNGTGFVNLSKYLDANQGNNLGSAVAGNINQATNAAQQDLSQQQGAFNTGLSQARSGLAQNQANIAATMGDINSPGFTGLSAPQVQQYQNFANTAYGGPAGLQNSQQLQQQATNAANLGKLAGSRTGRQQLLAQTVNSPGYSPTEQNMDELYMSLGGGQQAVQQAGRGTNQIQGQATNAINAANAQGTAAANQYNQAQQQAAAGITNEQNATNQQIANAVQQANTAYQATVPQLQNAINTNTLTAAQAQQLGLNLGSVDYGTNAANFFTAGAAPTTANIATTQQEAQLQALAQLAGQQSPQFNTSQAGTYNPYTFNNAGYNQTVAQGAANYQQGLQNDAQQAAQWQQANLGTILPNLGVLKNTQGQLIDTQGNVLTPQQLAILGGGGTINGASGGSYGILGNKATEQAALDALAAQQYDANQTLQ